MTHLAVGTLQSFWQYLIPSSSAPRLQNLDFRIQLAYLVRPAAPRLASPRPTPPLARNFIGELFISKRLIVGRGFGRICSDSCTITVGEYIFYKPRLCSGPFQRFLWWSIAGADQDWATWSVCSFVFCSCCGLYFALPQGHRLRHFSIHTSLRRARAGRPLIFSPLSNCPILQLDR